MSNYMQNVDAPTNHQIN